MQNKWRARRWALACALFVLASGGMSGKAHARMDIPPGTVGQPGVAEWIEQGIAAGIAADVLLRDGLMPGMKIVGQEFAANRIFIPEVLIASRAMKAGFGVLKTALTAHPLPARGVFVIGTVQGDLHDIGKNLVGIILEGAGWQVVDLGTDCPPDRFIEAIQRHDASAVGLSALLTTTMMGMGQAVAALRDHRPETVILVGGAPVTQDFARQIGADGYGADPAAAAVLLDRLVSDGAGDAA